MPPTVVTLKTLPTATAQEVFDHVAYHLLTQNEQATDKQNCRYRLQKPDGKVLRCGAGCLIADDEYSPDIERKKWRTLTQSIYAHGGVIPPFAPTMHEDLISELQELHDYKHPDRWEGCLIHKAAQFNLNPHVIKEAIRDRQ